MRLLSSLPLCETTFQLHHVDGLSIRETAELLGVPAGTAMARLARARSGPKEVVKRTAAAGTYGGSTESLHSGYDQKIEKLGRKKYGHTA